MMSGFSLLQRVTKQNPNSNDHMELCDSAIALCGSHAFYQRFHLSLPPEIWFGTKTITEFRPMDKQTNKQRKKENEERNLNK